MAEMGAHSCGPLRSHVNSFLDFCFAFRIPAFLYKICFAFLCAPAFLFRVPLLLCQRAYIHMRGGWGCNTCTVCLWTDQTGQVNLPPVHYPPSSCVRSVQYKYTKLVSSVPALKKSPWTVRHTSVRSPPS